MVTKRVPGRDRLGLMFRLVTLRNPDNNELSKLLKTYSLLRDGYRQSGKAAKALVGVGESKSDATEPTKEEKK